MQADSGIDLTALKVDGGACANNYPTLQTMADISNLPVKASLLRGNDGAGRGVSQPGWPSAIGATPRTCCKTGRWTVSLCRGIPDDERADG